MSSCRDNGRGSIPDRGLKPSDALQKKIRTGWFAINLDRVAIVEKVSQKSGKISNNVGIAF